MAIPDNEIFMAVIFSPFIAIMALQLGLELYKL
jgi:hypothetical protein